MGIGIDIVDMRRIKDAERFAEGILSVRELALMAAKPDKLSFVAGRFAAKEAFMKALGQGLDQIPLKAIEVLYRGPNMAPYVLFNNVEYDVSIAHDGDYAIATASI
ncbi:MAG TPA: holo-ACP synthase [Bacilli bacterium]|jgi:holo-[acyl-carrier protein] synthase|nr:holo-ACP synthase [Bacilli bacterium]HNY74735.1 holo-ACP synthase [Bacilli bacterium]HOF53828.1 holo-ACP synthase [Bacilli bacterium]HOH68735.1 holo-ACP synthase [Bacilli bacterium]HOR20717.1 holo-ACP synthase [Bacilli bacterium]